MKKADLDLYNDYLLSAFGEATATGLSAMVEDTISHDKVTRFLSEADYTSKNLWQQVKPMVNQLGSVAFHLRDAFKPKRVGTRRAAQRLGLLRLAPVRTLK